MYDCELARVVDCNDGKFLNSCWHAEDVSRREWQLLDAFSSPEMQDYLGGMTYTAKTTGGSHIPSTVPST